MSIELLPCPHCGGGPSTPTNWGDPSRPIPRCTRCGSESPSPAAWNRRTPGPDASPLLAALAEAIRRRREDGEEAKWTVAEIERAWDEYESAGQGAARPAQPLNIDIL